jgi:two-component system sensor histidine kinase KdpD
MEQGGPVSGRSPDVASGSSAPADPEPQQPAPRVATVVVAITAAPSSDEVIRRAAGVGQHPHRRLLGVHVTGTGEPIAAESPGLAAHRRLVTDLGGTCHEVVSDDVADALLRFARSEHATQLVLGATGRTRWSTLTRGSVVNALLAAAGSIDVQVIGTTAERLPRAGLPTRRPSRGPRLPRRRRRAGWALVVVGIPVLTAVLALLRPHLNLTSSTLVYLLLVTVTAVVGGAWPALTAAVLSSVAVNWFFTPPLHTLVIGSGENLLALAIFLTVAALVSTVVSQATRRGAAVTKARAEAEALARVAGGLVGEDEGLAEMVTLLRRTFGFDGVTVLERAAADHRVGEPDWNLIEAAGSAIAARPADGTALPLGDTAVLVLQGQTLTVDDRHLLEVFAAQVSSAIERRRLRRAAADAAALAETDQLRTAILRAVSHDLRSPLASIKASVTSLLQGDVAWTDHDRREFLATIDEESDRLNELVGNLLDMSRIEAGAVTVSLRPVALEETVGRALASISGPTAPVVVDVSERTAPALADAVLLERAVANVVGNAMRFSPGDRSVRIEAAENAGRVALKVIDHGPGVPRAEHALLFAPFQRLGDQDSGAGVGLGLAVSRGFVEAMGGTLRMESTVGGGLTAVIDLPAVILDVDSGQPDPLPCPMSG